MTEITKEHVNLIFPEMMVHPVLFTHPNPRKIVFLSDPHHLILREVLKHNNVAEIYHTDPKIKQEQNNKLMFNDKLDALKTNSIDVIINANDFNPDQAKQHLSLLHKDGILIQQSISPFDIDGLKSLIHTLRQMGFSDIQLLSFPQPNYATGWRSILMALKHGMFKRLREKVVFNKPFKTAYYNFDVHKAAAVLPEFMRNSNLF